MQLQKSYTYQIVEGDKSEAATKEANNSRTLGKSQGSKGRSRTKSKKVGNQKDAASHKKKWWGQEGTRLGWGRG